MTTDLMTVSRKEKILGVEGGGTKTAWILFEREGVTRRQLAAGKLAASNFRLTSSDRLLAMFRHLPTDADRVGVFLAGCVTPEDRRKLSELCAHVWPRAQIVTGSDRDSGIAAALGQEDGIAVNAGTGSSVTGRRGGVIEKAGGWGHILGDAGGGYFLSVQALRLLLREYDLRRGERGFAAKILRELALNTLDDLVRWAQDADKMQIAMLTPVVFAAAESGDLGLQEILRLGARALAEYTAAVAARLNFDAPEVRLLGGLFQCCEVYVSAFRRELLEILPAARVTLSPLSPEAGAAALAAADLNFSEIVNDQTVEKSDPLELATAWTEQTNPRSANLGEMTTLELVTLFVNEETYVQDALRQRTPELVVAIELIANALAAGGRLFYVGAGTSGRLGVLDASEIPPTFGASPELVQGIIAGGVTALHRSVEGSEDEAADGALAIDARGVTSKDVVCGIAASGRTPFVLGALGRAIEIGARTILLTCNPARVGREQVDVAIDLETGAELLTGSTRLKAGTATKIALNILSTGAMVTLGKVHGNLMIDVVASNRKLRDRAARIFSELTHHSYEEAVTALGAHGWSLRAAIGAYEDVKGVT